VLYLTLRDLFSLQVDMVFYDLTSTYFEGSGPPEMGAHGHSRDGKPRNPQVLVGLVLVDGWPIAHHVFQGNWRCVRCVPPRSTPTLRPERAAREWLRLRHAHHGGDRWWASHKFGEPP
jgi:hypothetical protein